MPVRGSNPMNESTSHANVWDVLAVVFLLCCGPVGWFFILLGLVSDSNSN
jgi:hypothetical protein